jgi:hypothetical protein
MNPLYILTTATDKTRAAVTSMTDSTPVTSLEQMVLGDTATLTIYFTTGTAAPAWAGASGYTLNVGLGTLDAGGAAAYTSSTSFTGITNGWTGNLSLNTARLVDALALQVGSAIDWTRFPTQARVPFPRPQYGWFNLQISVTDPSGYTTTYAELRVPLLNRVLPNGVATTEGADDAVYAYIRAGYTQSRTLFGIASASEDSTKLCGIKTLNTYSAGARMLASFPNNIQAFFELTATTSTNAGFLFAPFDYNATTNAVKWRLRSVWILGQPAIYNNDTTLWHYLVAVGAADAVAVTCDQTGTALPT